MFRSTGKKIGLLIGGIALFLVATAAINVVAIRKPWGVPDDRREEYEQKLVTLQQQALTKAKYQNADRPIAKLSTRTFRLGYVQPSQHCRSEIVLTNNGTEMMEASVAPAKVAGLHLSLESSNIEAGGSTRIILEGPASDFQPDQQPEISLKTNDPLNPSFELDLSGEHALAINLPSSVAFDRADPGDDLSCQFEIYSQQDTPFEIVDIRCDTESFLWDAEPIAVDQMAVDQVAVDQVAGENAKSAKHISLVTVSHQRFQYGAYFLPTEVDIRQGDKVSTYQTTLKGRIRSPISFKSPDLHRDTGLNIGTLGSDQSHQVNVGVSLRSEKHRTLDILDAKPNELDFKLVSLKREGLYRLTITVPKDCPTVVFNRENQHGYVKVGDPDDTNFSSWFPLYGVIADDL